MNQRHSRETALKKLPPVTTVCDRRFDSAATQLLTSKLRKISGLCKQFNPKVNGECSIPRSVKLSGQVAELRSFRDTGWTLTNVGSVLKDAPACSLHSCLHTAKIAVSYCRCEGVTHIHRLISRNSFGRACVSTTGSLKV